MALIELGNPELLLLVPLFVTLTLLGHYFAQKIKRSLEVFHFPPIRRLSRLVLRKGFRTSHWRGISLALKLVIIVIVTFSLANPTLLTFREVSENVEVPMVMEKDVMGQVLLTIDVSGSMGIKDVFPSRLDVAKQMLVEFVENSSDKVRFGVVAFERAVMKLLPVTQNKSEVVSAIKNLMAAEVLPCLEEFTDIGEGIQTSLDLLAPYASSKIGSAIILASDGFTNFGYPSSYTSVFQASARASNLGISVYTLHIARMGQDSNDELMKQIASETKGKFMDSSSLEELRNVLEIISKYYVPTHEWSTKVDIKTTIPARTDLGSLLMFVAAIFIIALWAGNYKHYKTSF